MDAIPTPIPPITLYKINNKANWSVLTPSFEKGISGKDEPIAERRNSTPASTRPFFLPKILPISPAIEPPMIQPIKAPETKAP